MVEVFTLLWSALTSLLRSRVRLEAETLILRQQISVLRRNSRRDLPSELSTAWCSLGCVASFPEL
jgi:hypothetical protein